MDFAQRPLAGDGQGDRAAYHGPSLRAMLAGDDIEMKFGPRKVLAPGRASGPHLDWRMNWLDRRVDPQRLVPAGGNEPTP